MNLFDRVLKPLNEELGEAALVLNSNARPPKYPWLFTLSLIASTSIAANYYSSALILSPISIPVLKDSRLRKPLLMVIIFSIVVSLPILIINPYKFVDFNVRVLTSTALGFYLVSLTGWDGLIVALRDIGLPTEIALALRMLPSQLYSFLHSLNTLIIARRARSFNTNYRKLWELLSTAIGNLLIKGIVKSQRTSMAIKARGLVFVSSKRFTFPTLISLIALGVSVIGIMLGGRLV